MHEQRPIVTQREANSRDSGAFRRDGRHPPEKLEPLVGSGRPEMVPFTRNRWEDRPQNHAELQVDPYQDQQKNLGLSIHGAGSTGRFTEGDAAIPTRAEQC